MIPRSVVFFQNFRDDRREVVTEVCSGYSFDNMLMVQFLHHSVEPFNNSQVCFLSSGRSKTSVMNMSGCTEQSELFSELLAFVCVNGFELKDSVGLFQITT